MSEKKDFISTRKGVTYLDLFAGAGGFSEGFMQAYTDDKYYDFRLASDINENCELTHRVRYNKMLGLDTKFMCQDIMDDSFLPNLIKEIGNQEIDVITGGPSCQSFSLAGRRKKLDKRDDLTRICMETADADWNRMNELYFNSLDQQLKDVTRTLPYNVSKSNEAVNTIRHGLILLKMRKERESIRKQVIQLKTSAHIDNDTFVDGYNAIVETISDEQILERTLKAVDEVAAMGKCDKEAWVLRRSLEILTATFDECIDFIREQFRDNEKLSEIFENLMSEIRLYNITEPMVLLSSNYGVPQNRERVVFIGCRNDQELITEIPATVSEDEKVKVYEAIWDMDMVGNGDTATTYKEPKVIPAYEAEKKKRGVPHWLATPFRHSWREPLPTRCCNI